MISWKRQSLSGWLIFVMVGLSAHGGEPPSSVQEAFGSSRSTKDHWAEFLPYAPQNREYFFDIGSMWERQNMYWLGGELGFHLGNCVFSESPTCQQYFDLIGGVAGAEGITMGMALVSLRWQFVHFPSRMSPSVRIFTGINNLHDEDRNRQVMTSGLGYALTASLHPRMDLKLEVRAGFGRQQEIWSQVYIALGLKLDSWVDYFTTKLKQLGRGTAEVLGVSGSQKSDRSEKSHPVESSE